MATQVVLLEQVEKLGKMGEVVSVKPGYARNFLLPQGKALRATKDNIAYFEAQKKNLEAENEKRRKEAEKLAKKLEGMKVSLIRQASEAGQLYGSVTSRDIAAQASENSKEKIERSMVQLNTNFKSVGLFSVDLALHPEVKVEVIINIARTPEEAEIQAKTGKALVAEEAEAQEEKVEEVEVPEAALEEVLEESALEAEKEKQAAEEESKAEEEKAKAKAEARAAKKAEKKATEEEAAEAEQTETEESTEEAPAEEEKAEESEEKSEDKE